LTNFHRQFTLAFTLEEGIFQDGRQSYSPDPCYRGVHDGHGQARLGVGSHPREKGLILSLWNLIIGLSNPGQPFCFGCASVGEPAALNCMDQQDQHVVNTFFGGAECPKIF
jgi:hypothetical protein